MKTKILIIASICISTNVLAGGYRVALQGQNATGMGHTGVAMTDSAEVVFFNPAGMSSLKKNSSLSAGVTLIDSTIKYQNAPTNTSAETDNPVGTPLYLYYAKKFNSQMSLGLGIYTPFGNTVNWEKDWQGSHLVNDISLKTVYVQPTISYKVNDKISLGAGPIYANGSVEFNRDLGTALADENGDPSNVTIKANNISSYGFSLGLLAKPMNELTVGLNYRSRIDLEARGANADFSNVKSGLQAKFSDTTFDSDLVLPAELTLGIAYHLMPKTLLAIDINRTLWSQYKSLNVTFDNGTTPPSLGPRNYKDVNVYRVGIQHKVNSFITVRGGAYYDDSPVQAGYYTPETPRNDSIGFTAGGSLKVSNSLDVSVSFLYLLFKEFNGSYDYVGHDNDPATLDSSFGGDYLSSVTSVGLGFNYKY